MADQDSTGRDGSDFNRPWEDDDATADVVPLPGLGAETPDDDDEGGDVFSLADDLAGARKETDVEEPSKDPPDWDALAEGPRSLDHFTSDEYISSSTQEYQGLADDVTRAASEEWQMQAVAANLPGVESGLVGFEDVSGRSMGSEESYEAIEQAASSDLTMRVASALVIFGVFLGSLLLTGWWFTSFVVLVMIVSVGEFYATVRTKGYRPLALFGLIGVALIGVGAHNWGAAAIAGWAILVSVVTILFFSLTPRSKPLENTSLTILGMVWGGMLAFAILIGRGPHPVAHILFFVLLVALNDIGAFFVGRAFGRRKLAPRVSPNKTVEGLIGGLLVGAAAASVMVVFPPWEPIGLLNGLIAAAIVGVLGPIGDLAESMVKRSITVKDMGSVLPGHGGMLDRIDGFLFVVPAVYFFFRALELL